MTEDPPADARGRRDSPEAPGPASGDFDRGRVVGDFRLNRKLGEGGMGEVWEAEQLSLSRLVALKLMPSGRILSDARLAMFEREAKAGGRLAHPNIVSVLCYGEADGIPYIAQELIGDGRSLKDVIHEARLEYELPANWYRRVAECFASVADALQVAHEAGVIHRDVKPQNILVATDDRPMVADFGLAKVSGTESISRTGDLAGTYCYMSPEQALAKRIGIDHLSDVFSLGTTFYETLTLTRPFDGDTHHQVTEAICFAEPPDPRQIRSRVPRDLAVICLKAIEKRRQDRFASMAEFADDLRRHLADEPILSRPAGAILRARKWVRRHPTRSVAIATTAIALLAISSLALRLFVTSSELEQKYTQLAETISARDDALAEAQAQRDRAEESSYVASLHAARAALETLNIREAKRLLALAPESQRDWEWHWLALQLDQSMRVVVLDSRLPASLAWHPDGQHILGAAGETLRSWGTLDGRYTDVVGGLDWTPGLSLSPDGLRIMTGSDDGNILLWSVESGDLLHSMTGDGSFTMALAWSPDGSTVASVSSGGSFRVWDATDGESLIEDDEGVGMGFFVAYDPSGQIIISGHAGGLAAWDSSSGERLPGWGEPGKTKESATAGAWSPDGQRVAVGSGDGSLAIWRGASGELERVLLGQHEDLVYDVVWSPLGARVASAAGDNTVRIWDAATGELIQTLIGHDDAVVSLNWDPGAGLLSSASLDGTLRTWDSGTNLPIHPAPAMALAWSPDGARIASDASGSDLCIWDAASGDGLLKLSGHERGVNAVGWDPNGDRVASASSDGTVRIWDSETGESLLVLAGHTDGVTGVAWSPDGSRIASGSHDETLRLWDTQTNRALRVLSGHTDSVWAVSWSPDGSRLASGSDDGSVGVWDASTGERLLEVPAPGGYLRLASWSPDGASLAGSTDEDMMVWDASTGTLLNVLSGHTDDVTGISWNPTSSRIVSASEDGTLRIWDATTGESLLILTGHDRRVNAVAWSPDGRRIASSSNDSTLRIWESALVDALPTWRGAELRDRVRPRIDAAFGDHVLLPQTLEALATDPLLPDELRDLALRMATFRGPPSAWYVNRRAWELVDPDRADVQTDVALGLRLSREAVQRAPTDPAYRVTLAWALWANDHYGEALVESETALGLMDVESAEDARRTLDRLRQLIEDATALEAPGAEDPQGGS